LKELSQILRLNYAQEQKLRKEIETLNNIQVKEEKKNVGFNFLNLHTVNKVI